MAVAMLRIISQRYVQVPAQSPRSAGDGGLFPRKRVLGGIEQLILGIYALILSD